MARLAKCFTMIDSITSTLCTLKRPRSHQNRSSSFANKGARFHCTGILRRQTRLDIVPEGLRRLLDKTRAEWYEDANTAPLPIHFPAEVRTKLENIFGPTRAGI